MGRGAAETILHGIVAALAVMVILGVGRIRASETRLAFWLLAMGCPVIFTPLCWLLFPARAGEDFRDGWSLFSGNHLSLLTWHGVRAGSASAFVLMLAGSLLYLRDLVPFVLDVVRGRTGKRDLAAIPEALAAAVARASAALATTAPRLAVLSTRHPVLICRGLRRPLIVTSTGLLELLAPDELAAAIAHEISHANRRDPLLGWGLMLVRGLFFFNPSVQLCARAAVHEIERRADLAAARAVASPGPVARSLRKLAGAGHDRPRPAHGRAWHGFRLAAIEDRCRALEGEGEAKPAPCWTLAATAIGLGVILFFTVA
jgi:Zn-dependent protease with chaperone function